MKMGSIQPQSVCWQQTTNSCLTANALSQKAWSSRLSLTPSAASVGWGLTNSPRPTHTTAYTFLLEPFHKRNMQENRTWVSFVLVSARVKPTFICALLWRTAGRPGSAFLPVLQAKHPAACSAETSGNKGQSLINATLPFPPQWHAAIWSQLNAKDELMWGVNPCFL